MEERKLNFLVSLALFVTILILMAVSAKCQTAPDTPSTAQPPAPAVKHCGPAWLGGCWDQLAPRRSNLAVVKDPYFLWPTVTDAIVTSLDGAVTSYGLNHSVCEEANVALGKHPSTGRIAGINALFFGVATGFRFVALKAIPEDNHSHWAAIPRALSIFTAARSADVHVRGAVRWFTSGCL